MQCPKCGSKVQQIETGPNLYRCNECKMLTDCEDDGVVGYGNPTRFASRDEEFQQRQKQRQQGRRHQHGRKR